MSFHKITMFQVILQEYRHRKLQSSSVVSEVSNETVEVQ